MQVVLDQGLVGEAGGQHVVFAEMALSQGAKRFVGGRRLRQVAQPCSVRAR